MTIGSSCDEVAQDLQMRSLQPPSSHGLVCEQVFSQRLALERKRTERSQRPFLLMLLDMSGPLWPEKQREALVHALETLALRETDVAGWHKSGLVIGVMFTEIEVGDKRHAQDAILGRISGVLHSRLSFEQASRLEISFHWFPGNWRLGIPPEPEATVFYPDGEANYQKRKLFRTLKRMADLIGGVAALALTSPIFLTAAVAIKLNSKGPVFYKQRRIGQNGVPFSLYKFRSMYEGCNHDAHKKYVSQLIAGAAEKKPSAGNGEGIYKLTGDSRITRVGALLRRTSLDELPQLINVLKGEMSLVGPRPPIDYEVDEYQPWHRRRVMEAKPGITGLWQVNGRNRIAFDDMVRLDLQYARCWSPWLDLKILLRTPKALIAGAN